MVNNVTIMYKDKRGDIWMGGGPNSGLIRLTPNKEFGKLKTINFQIRMSFSCIYRKTPNISAYIKVNITII